MNTPVAGPTTTRYPVTGTPLTTTQTTASNSGYPPPADDVLSIVKDPGQRLFDIAVPQFGAPDSPAQSAPDEPLHLQRGRIVQPQHGVRA